MDFTGSHAVRNEFAPEAISDIFVTHAHFDHMGSIAEFPNAQIYIQKSELLSWYEAIALPKRFGHLTAIIDPTTFEPLLTPRFNTGSR